MHHGSKRKSTMFLNKTFTQIRHRPWASRKLPGCCRSCTLVLPSATVAFCLCSLIPVSDTLEHTFLWFTEIRNSAQKQTQHRRCQNIRYETKIRFYHSEKWETMQVLLSTVPSTNQYTTFLHKSMLTFFFLKISEESTKYFK